MPDDGTGIKELFESIELHLCYDNVIPQIRVAE